MQALRGRRGVKESISCAGSLRNLDLRGREVELLVGGESERRVAAVEMKLLLLQDGDPTVVLPVLHQSALLVRESLASSMSMYRR